MIKKAKEANLDVVDTLDEVLEGANFVISMLPEGKHVKSLFLGDKGIIDKNRLIWKQIIIATRPSI